ncbi:hypothetical protein [Mitsuokella sp. oral taxon 131]|uniref:hypothetical protein n=1 Tax=Mitsuokella sp. oral taxon 131 TaxID=1321780 RepID=UPI0003AD89D5|nr:hypothetical protein [Mitsuokella sp. oral taxon 131]ERL03990.1 hypothetical protein HMPREF1985_01709 [Mitsuokella sp. oral taxon 131 str. W9106]
MEGIPIGFIKAHARGLSNRLLALLVVAAIAATVQGEELEHLVKIEDPCLLGGAFLALLLLRMVGRGRRK